VEEKDILSPPSKTRLGQFLARHRRELKVLAQTGCVLCLVRMATALFKLDRPNDRTYIFLVVGFFALYYCARAAADPLAKDKCLRVPTWVRRGFQPALMTCWAAVAAASLLNIFTGRPSGAAYHVLVVGGGSGFLALLYALEAMFFAYGDLKDSSDEGTEHRSQEPQELS
jgi:hypothetical protein